MQDQVKKSAFGGLLRNIPVVGGSMADRMEYEDYRDQYRTSLSQEELNKAWAEVQPYFRECPTCHQIVCVPDFDEVSGYCVEHSPRAAEIEQAKAEQAANYMKGLGNAFGLGNAVQQAAQ